MDTNHGLIRDQRWTQARLLRTLHGVNTIWFIVCLAYLMIMALHQAGFRWWVIFSLSGYSAVLVFVLISLYLFALFRGVSRNRQVEPEHPLTCSDSYMVLYTAGPFLGGIAGCLSGIGPEGDIQFLHRVALGTFVTTFLVWVILDPSLAVIEGLFPTSRKHRTQRLARREAERREREIRRQQVLAQVLETEQTHRRLWQQALEPYARELAALLNTDVEMFSKARARAIEIGAEAWRLGGIGCMRQLREMTETSRMKRFSREPLVDYLSYWWDGIGTWRGPNS
jgi:hypothetical protein